MNAVEQEQEEEPLFVSTPPTEKINITASPAASLLPPQLLSTENQDQSWSFSMISDDDEEINLSLNNVAHAETTKISKPKETNIKPMANWQIDTISSVTGPTANDGICDDLIKAAKNSPRACTSMSSAVSAMPSFINPQKRALPDAFSSDEISENPSNKRISLPSVNRQSEALSNAGVSNSIEVSTTSPQLSSSAHPAAVQQLPQSLTNPTILDRLSSRATLPIPSPLNQRQKTSRIVSMPPQRNIISTANPAATTQVDLMQSFGQKARIHNEPAFSPYEGTKSTQNQSLTIMCDFDAIKANYSNYKKQHNKMHRISIEDYLALQQQAIQGHDMDAKLISTTPTTQSGLAFYSRGGVYELGVVKLKALCINAIYNQLLKNHNVICKKKLERPVQIQFG